MRVLLLVCFCVAVCFTAGITFDASNNMTPFPHIWEECVGSGHALLALRADYREYLTRCRTELGFRSVRFHGLLDDDISTYSIVNGRPTYSFFNIDSIFDFLLSIDMRPMIEISFMPELLASGGFYHFPLQGQRHSSRIARSMEHPDLYSDDPFDRSLWD